MIDDRESIMILRLNQTLSNANTNTANSLTSDIEAKS